MSSKAPSKKRKKKTPWVRRIVSTLILIALLVGIVFGLAKGFSWVTDFFKSENQKNKDAVSVQPVTYGQCGAGNLDVTLTPSAPAVQEGGGVDVALSIVNTSTVPCVMKVGDLQIDLATAGAEPVWTPTACSADLGDEQLLLSKGQPWSTTFSWDGKAYKKCEVQAQPSGRQIDAPEGVYDLRIAPFGTPPQAKAQLAVK